MTEQEQIKESELPEASYNLENYKKDGNVYTREGTTKIDGNKTKYDKVRIHTDSRGNIQKVEKRTNVGNRIALVSTEYVAGGRVTRQDIREYDDGRYIQRETFDYLKGKHLVKDLTARREREEQAREQAREQAKKEAIKKARNIKVSTPEKKFEERYREATSQQAKIKEILLKEGRYYEEDKKGNIIIQNKDDTKTVITKKGKYIKIPKTASYNTKQLEKTLSKRKNIFDLKPTKPRESGVKFSEKAYKLYESKTEQIDKAIKQENKIREYEYNKQFFTPSGSITADKPTIMQKIQQKQRMAEKVGTVGAITTSILLGTGLSAYRYGKGYITTFISSFNPYTYIEIAKTVGTKKGRQEFGQNIYGLGDAIIQDPGLVFEIAGGIKGFRTGTGKVAQGLRSSSYTAPTYKFIQGAFSKETVIKMFADKGAKVGNRRAKLRAKRSFPKAEIRKHGYKPNKQYENVPHDFYSKQRIRKANIEKSARRPSAKQERRILKQQQRIERAEAQARFRSDKPKQTHQPITAPKTKQQIRNLPKHVQYSRELALKEAGIQKGKDIRLHTPRKQKNIPQGLGHKPQIDITYKKPASKGKPINFKEFYKGTKKPTPKKVDKNIPSGSQELVLKQKPVNKQTAQPLQQQAELKNVQKVKEQSFNYQHYTGKVKQLEAELKPKSVGEYPTIYLEYQKVPKGFRTAGIKADLTARIQEQIKLREQLLRTKDLKHQSYLRSKIKANELAFQQEGLGDLKQYMKTYTDIELQSEAVAIPVSVYGTQILEHELLGKSELFSEVYTDVTTEQLTEQTLSLVQALEYRQTQALVLDQELELKQRQEQDLKLKPISVQELVTTSKPKQKNFLTKQPRIKTTPKPKPREEKPYKPKKRKINIIPDPFKKKKIPPIIDIDLEERRKKDKSFSVSVKKKGRFTKIGRDLTKQEAFSRGFAVVDTSALASFKIEQEGKDKKKGFFNLLPNKKLRPSRALKNVFVEKRKFRIDTAGEKKDITFRSKLRLKL